MFLTRFNWVFSIFIKTFWIGSYLKVAVFVYNISNFYDGFVWNPSKVQRSPFEQIACFLWKECKKIISFIMCWSLFRFNARLINLPWIHDMKARHEQQKDPNYLKNKPFSECYNYFSNAYNELLIKIKNNLILKAVFRKRSWKTLLESLY